MCWHTFPIHDANWEKRNAYKQVFSLNYYYGDECSLHLYGITYTRCAYWWNHLGQSWIFDIVACLIRKSKKVAKCLLFRCFIRIFLWYISSGVAVVRRLYVHRSASLLRARGNFERMQQWQMGRGCANQDKTMTKRRGRKGRRGGWKNRVRNKVFVSHCPPFSISAGQRQQANMIYSQMCQQKTDCACVCVCVRKTGREGMKGKEEERKRKSR